MIYFARAGDTDLVKIGYARDIAARLAVLQAGNHLSLILEREMRGGRETEAWLHRHYADRCVSREWFRWCETMRHVRPLIESTKGLVHSLGGPVALAAALGVTPRAARAWIYRGVAWRYRMPVSRLAMSMGVDLPPGFLEASEGEAA